MYLPTLFLMSILLRIAEGFTVKGPSGPLVVPLGGSVLLPCSVDSLSSVEDLEVEWKRSDSQTLISLYQDGDMESFNDRAHFFTDDIKHGNFSLLLKNVTAEDEGQYTCTVHSGQESNETVVEIKDVERLIVSGSDQSLSVYVGEDVTLNCSVDSHIPPEHIEEVSWKKRDKDEHITVLLYQNNETFPEASDERYRDRVEFFTDEIHRGNFSLRLKRVRTEDKGLYMCHVFAGRFSDNTTVVLQQLGVSALHIMVLILCIAACGSAFLFYCLIYWTSHKKEFVVEHSHRSFVPLGDSVVLPCFIDPRLLTESLKVEWRRSDSQTLIRLYQHGAEDQQHDRANFFTEKIKHGDFSLQLENVTAEDKGQYTCTVYSGQDSVFTISTKLILGLLVDKCSFAPLGDSVVLPCFIDPSLLTESLKVEWRRSDSQTLVHLYQDGAAVQQQDYRKRAQFFTEKIKDGDFSLQLKKVKAEDAGEYRCTVYSGQDSLLFNSILELGFDVDCTVVSLGGSVLLPCFGPRLRTDSRKVEWKRSETLVHLYQDGDIRSEEQHQDYHDRAHFFTDNIEDGDFSLRLDHMRAEDEGQYECVVYSGQISVSSANTRLTLRLIHTALRLQMFLVFCPNIIMFFAFVFWGVSEGSVNETVFCCALYIVRPLMLLFTAPYKEQFTGKIETLLNWSLETDYISFTTVVYSVLFKSAWEKSLNYTASERAMIIALFVIVLLLCLIDIIYVLLWIAVKLSQRIDTIFLVVANIIFYVLPSLQFVLLFFTFESATGGFFIVAVLPVITSATRYNWNIVCGDNMGCSPLVRRLVWIVLMSFINAVLIYFYITALEKENDRVGWACTIGFLQVIWTVWNCLYSFGDWGFTRITAVYVFGSVGVVIFSAVGLMTELVLKTLNGEGLVGDLRIIVFSSESLFTALVVIIIILSPWIKKDLQCCQIPAKCKKAAPTESPQNQNAAGDQEMNPLVNPQKTDKNREADETQT